MILRVPNISQQFVEPGQWVVSVPWYKFFEAVVSGLTSNGTSITTINAHLTTIDGEITTIGGHLTTIDGHLTTIDGEITTINTFLANKNLGWTASTGTALKTAYATYAGQVISALPAQAEVQQIDDKLVLATERIKALEDALRNFGVIN